MKKDRIINMLYSYSVISGVIGGLFVLGCIFFVLNTSLFNPIRLAVIVDLVMIGCVCYYALYTFFKVIKNIKEEHSFSRENIHNMKIISLCFIIVTILIFAGSIIVYMFHLLDASLLILSLVFMFITSAFVVVSYSLASLIEQAVLIKEENDLTI